MELKLNYLADIQEQGFMNGEFIIQGTAINAVTTSNNHKFLSEELQKSASTLKGVPLLKDHENTIDSIVGKVLSSEFVPQMDKIDFRAKVMDEKSQELIKEGLLNTVSVGAIVKDIEEEDGLFIPRGITFKELSLVAVPADSGATFQIALKEAYNTKEGSDKSHLNITREVKMTEEETQTSEETPEVQTEPEVEPEAKAEEETKEPEPTETAEEVEAKIKKAQLILKQLELKALQESIKLKEADADEVPVEEPAKEEPKEEEAEEEVEEGYKFEQNFGAIRGGSITLVR